MIAYIIDGTKQTVQLKGYLECSDSTPLRKSADREAFTTLICVGDIANLVREYDIVRLETRNGMFWGGVVEAKLTKGNENVVEITFAMDTDFILNDVPRFAYLMSGEGNLTTTISGLFWTLFRKSSTTTPPFFNINCLRREYETNQILGEIVFTDQQLPFSQVCRQLYKQGVRPYFELVGDVIYLRLEKDKLSKISINLEDTLDYSIDLKSDTFNHLIAVVMFGTTPSVNIYYIDSNGNVKTDANINAQSQLELPLKTKVQEFQPRDNNTVNIEEQIEFIKNQSYANNAMIKINQDYLYLDYFDPNIFRNLGREIELYLNDYNIKLRSVINEIEIKDNVIMLTMGLSQTRLFDRLRRR